MMKDHPHSRSADGRDYVCASCGETLPDGVLVDASWTKGGKVNGVRAFTTDDVTIHACGTFKGA